MKQNKTVGIILLVLAALTMFGSIANGTFATLGDQNIGFLVGFFGAFAALVIIGILKIVGKK